MIIRNATETDIPQLTQLKKPKTDKNRKMFETNQITRIHEMSEGSAVYLVAQENNHLVGCVFLSFSGSQTEPGYPTMNDLYVDQTQRNQGIGTQLIHEAEQIAKEGGYDKISLCVNPTLNPRAKALYENLGYNQTTTEAYLDGIYDEVEDWCVDMVKTLA